MFSENITIRDCPDGTSTTSSLLLPGDGCNLKCVTSGPQAFAVAILGSCSWETLDSANASAAEVASTVPIRLVVILNSLKPVF